MKIWLDDIREAPEGWTRTRTFHETITLLLCGDCRELSLDHDLGTMNKHGEEVTGYDVLLWLEQAAVAGVMPMPRVTIHSANPPGRRRMEAAIASIKRLTNRS